MILYHGTSIKNADKIMKNGFKDRVGANINNWPDAVPSTEGFIYLTMTYPFFFGSVAANTKDSMAAIIKVKVHEKDIYPDEDFLKQAMRLKDDEHVDITQYKNFGMLSVKKLGNCAVKPDAITIVDRKDFNISEMFAYSDPLITLTNFLVMSCYYKTLVKRWWSGQDYKNIDQMEMISKSIQYNKRKPQPRRSYDENTN